VSSAVDISNLALSHFGQDASIDALDPPDGSAEAEHAAAFFPIARDELLEQYVWTFATFRATLAALTNDREDWLYRYALPTNCIKPRIVLPDGYDDSDQDGVPFEREGDSLYTDAEDATLVFTKRITDTTKFTPLFVTTLTWRLGSYLAGPVTKDTTGQIQARLYRRSEMEAAKGAVSNAGSTRNRVSHTPTARRAR
jgi:hypothetical protein